MKGMVLYRESAGLVWVLHRKWIHYMEPWVLSGEPAGQEGWTALLAAKLEVLKFLLTME